MVIGHDKYALCTAVNTELYKMSNIWRYSSRLIQKPENLAEHSFYVAFSVYELGNVLGIDSDRINKAVKIALCHDCGEIYTGDLPHSLKMYSPKIRELSEELEIKLIKENFPFFGDDFESFVKNEDPIVKNLVDLADVSDVIMFIDREESLGNRNEDILQIRAECSERFVKIRLQLEELISQENKNKLKGE